MTIQTTSATSLPWVKFKNGSEIKWGPIEDRATLGSAGSSDFCLLTKGVAPFHGQFLVGENQQIFFRNFENRAFEKLSTASSNFQIGPWSITLLSTADLEAEWTGPIRQKFKALLREGGSLGFEELYAQLLQDSFLNITKIPLHWQHSLGREFEEVSLSSPIEFYLKSEEITDILVEDFETIWLEKNGELVKATQTFANPESYHLYIENLLSELEKSLDESFPFADFVLKNGSRGHVIGPPLTPEGRRYLSIRKNRQDFFQLEQLLNRKMFSDPVFTELLQILSERKNILVSGATGSGKTTLLKAMLHRMPVSERVLLIEDTPELKIDRPNSAYLYTRIDSRGVLPAVTLRDLVRQSLRMRPDRIVIGEVRGPEALDLLNAMNTGHRGCMGSLHANSAADAVLRLQGLVRMSEAALSELAIADLIGRNLHYVIHVGKKAGARQILEIGKVIGIEGHRVQMEIQSCAI